MVEKIVFAVIFFISAFACLAIEVFILPGFGVVGILGIILLIAAIAYSWIALGAVWGIGMLALSAILFGLGIWIVSRTKFGRRFVQSESLRGAVSALGKDHACLIGKEGVALSDLHPIGSALVAGQKIDVISRGLFIKKGAKLRIIETSGPRIIVEEVVESDK